MLIFREKYGPAVYEILIRIFVLFFFLSLQISALKLIADWSLIFADDKYMFIFKP